MKYTTFVRDMIVARKAAPKSALLNCGNTLIITGMKKSRLFVKALFIIFFQLVGKI